MNEQERNKDLDFLQEASKRISERTKEGTPLLPEDVLNVFEETFDSLNENRIVESSISIPFIIERENELFTAQTYGYNMCRGVGHSEEEAIATLKKQISDYNRTCFKIERKNKIDDMFYNTNWNK